MLNWSLVGVISVYACPIAMKNESRYWTSAKALRSRSPTLVLVTATLPGVFPLKSISK